ncbi:MAG: class I tRNA ligase family protein, partial [Clostridium sp.]
MPYSVETDRKWQQKWDETKLYEFDKSKSDKKLYCLEMFSYPSGARLHAGHWYNYGPTDTWARFKRMQGYSVFQPMGFDAFGLPAENYAIKTGVHPHDSTIKNIETMEKQLREMGAMFNWENELVTCLPEYYKWTQWIFLKFYEAGLAYRKEAPVNWCPSCNTVLANEQVLDGECERCSSAVTKKNLTQWFFNITKYADELLDKIDELDWPEKTKKIQKNWIGRSEGAEIEFAVENKDVKFSVFTTRADTLYGVTYVVIAPESPIVDMITTDEYKLAVENYKQEAAKQSEIERMSTSKEKSGVFTGAYALHPLTGE